MKSITIFCGSSFGTDKMFEEQAFLLGQTLAKRGITLTYGGAKVGLMGAIADGALSQNGKVIGVLPHFLQQKEVAHEGLTKLILVDSLHDRKLKLNELSDAAIALPGGFGTLEELFEMITWGQLGLHKKPVAVLNVNGFYDHLIAHVQMMVDKGFLKATNQKMLLVSDNIEELLELMDNYAPPNVGKWIKKEKL